MIEAYPLCWAEGFPRTQIKKYSRFKTTLAAARDFVKEEIRRIGGAYPIISTNVPVKNNGDLYANWQSYKIEDHGVAVYFFYNQNQVCLCCDTYRYVHENLYAVGRTIEALRQINRDGVSDFLNKTFTGFKAIEQSAKINCWEVLGISETKNLDIIKTAYRNKAKQLHTDVGGDKEAFILLNNANEEAIKFANK